MITFSQYLESLDPPAQEWQDHLYELACNYLYNGGPPNGIMKALRAHIGNKTDASEEDIQIFLKQIVDAVMEDPDCHDPDPFMNQGRGPNYKPMF